MLSGPLTRGPEPEVEDVRGVTRRFHPDRTHVGLTTYDAKDPDTSYPPIEPLRPPTGAPNVLVVLLDSINDTKERKDE